MLSKTLLVICGSIFTITSAQECKNQPADIGFLIDESGSVGASNFRKNLEVANKFVDLFDIGENSVQISVYAYTHIDTRGFDFTACLDKACLKNEITDVGSNYRGSGENFEMALQFAKNSMFTKDYGSRDLALKILLFFTDGQSTLVEGGAPLHAIGIIVYAIGVGGGVNVNQLNKIATNTSYVFQASDYNSLIGNVYNAMRDRTCSDVLQDACQRNPSPCRNGGTCISNGGSRYTCICPVGFTGHNCESDIDYCVGVLCHNGGTCKDRVADFICQCSSRFRGKLCEIDICVPFPSDVVFVIDSSMSHQNYRNTNKQFITNVTEGWKLDDTHFKVVVITVAISAQIVIDFDDSSDKTDFDQLVDNIQFSNGSSEIHKGIQLARDALLSRRRTVSGSPVRRFVIVLTDGLISSPSSIYNYNHNGDYIRYLAVAIGEDVSHFWLQRMVGSANNVFPYNNDKLRNFLINDLVDSSCGVCQTSAESDIAFAVDTSRGFTSTELSITVPSIINKIIPLLEIELTQSLVSLMTFSNSTNVKFGFNDFIGANNQDLQRKLSYYVQDDIETSEMALLIDGLSKHLYDTSLGARTTAKKVATIISSYNFSLPSDDIRVIQNRYTEIFTISLRDSENIFQAMSAIAPSAFHIGINGIFPFNSIDTFILSLVEQLYRTTCIPLLLPAIRYNKIFNVKNTK